MRVTPSFRSLVDVLRHRADTQPGDTAYTFLESGEQDRDSLTWAALESRARTIGAAIAERVPAGARVLVLCPPGLDFVSAFFGCLYAGAIAVPSYPPSGGRVDRTAARLSGMIADAGIALVVGSSGVERRRAQLDQAVPELAGIPWLACDELPEGLAAHWRPSQTAADQLAFLQYTSGSTATPRGVMVTHGNLLDNLRASARLARHDETSVSVSWLPVNHDMGLIEGVLQPAFSGFPAYLMAPAAFLQRPVRWLQAISRLRATHSGGPNFAYDLCVRRIAESDREALDLTSWRVAFNGAEPVRRATLEAFQSAFGERGFRWSTFRPAYGLAEHTLLVAGHAAGTDPVTLDLHRADLAAGHATLRPRRPSHISMADLAPVVGCGSVAGGARLVIVDPETRTALADGRVGEIWVSSPSVARGYWNRPAETEATFRAHLADAAEPFLRTGDLGFLLASQLFVTGRSKDVLIVRGLKHYPQDLEATAERVAPALRPGGCAAFSVDSEGDERPAIVGEIDPASAGGCALDSVIEAVRRGVTEVHHITPCAVVLVTAGSVPKTTSGKLQRFACRQAFLTGRLEVVAEWRDPASRIGPADIRVAS